MKSEFPEDVYEDSWCRLPLVERDNLPPAAQEIFDKISDPTGSSYAGMRGPGGVRLHSPRLAELRRPMTRYLRHETGIEPRVREVAILTTARHFNSRFEWQQHEPVARQAGVPEKTIQAIEHREPTEGLDETDALVIQITRRLWEEQQVTPQLFADALRSFGEQQLVDLIAIMGTYAGTAILLAAVDMQLP